VKTPPMSLAQLDIILWLQVHQQVEFLFQVIINLAYHNHLM